MFFFYTEAFAPISCTCICSVNCCAVGLASAMFFPLQERSSRRRSCRGGKGWGASTSGRRATWWWRSRWRSWRAVWKRCSPWRLLHLFKEISEGSLCLSGGYTIPHEHFHPLIRWMHFFQSNHMLPSVSESLLLNKLIKLYFDIHCPYNNTIYLYVIL